MRAALVSLSCVILSSLTLNALAQQRTVNAPSNNPNRNLSTSASLDFTVKLGKFLFFQLGTDNYPITNAPDTITFTATPTIPSSVSNANNAVTSWSGAAPTFSLQSTNATLPVKVRSNAGHISLKATVSSTLTNGTATLPLANLTISSSDSNLPAPLIPNSGTGASVNVTGTAFSNLVTDRSANWTFTYTLPSTAAPGVYQGKVTFTASSP